MVTQRVAARRSLRRRGRVRAGTKGWIPFSARARNAMDAHLRDRRFFLVAIADRVGGCAARISRRMPAVDLGQGVGNTEATLGFARVFEPNPRQVSGRRGLLVVTDPRCG